MNTETYFSQPENTTQRQYEALRAFFHEKQLLPEVSKKFGLAESYLIKLKNQFTKELDAGNNPFFELKKTGPKQRRTEKTVINTIVALRKQNYAITDIRATLHAENLAVSLDTINAVLRAEGFAPLPKRTHQERIAIQLPQKLTPPKSITWNRANEVFTTERAAGLLIFLPLIESLGIVDAIKKSQYPETTRLSSVQMVLSFLALKLMGNIRWSHDSVWSMDRAIGMFAGLNVLPKATTLSSYSYRVLRESNLTLLKNLVSCFQEEQEENEFNLDFKAIPHWGDESVLEKNWCGARSRGMKSILSLIVQSPQSGMINYTDAELTHKTQNDAVLDFVDFWKDGKGVPPKMLIFDSRFTTYENLDKLNQDGIKFLTIRRRGKKLIDQTAIIPEEEWAFIQIERAKGKKKSMRVYDHKVTLNKYEGEVREIILTDHGRQRPTFLITNDFDTDLKKTIQKYARRWLVEQEIAEQVSFFHLNSPSSSIVVKVDFDLTLSLLAHNLYRKLAKQLNGFEQCTAETLHRKFLDNGATVTIEKNSATVSFKKKTHLPILLGAEMIKNESIISSHGNLRINFSGSSVT